MVVARHLGVERDPHDLVVDEGALRAQAVRPAHVAVVGGEEDDGVVPGAGGLEGGEHGAEAPVGQPVEVDVVVEVAEPGRGVVGVDVAPEPVLLVPAPLAVGLGLGVEVVVEVGGQPVEHLGVRIGEDRQRVVVLPGRRLEHPADGGHLVGVPLAVAGLVDREPHHVVGVDQGDGEEPGPVVRIGAATVRRRCSAAAFFSSQWAALVAMIGSKWTPVPAQPMKWRSLPSQSAKP